MNKQSLDELKDMICKMKATLNVAYAALTGPECFVDAQAVAKEQVKYALDALEPWMTILWENKNENSH